MHKESGGHYIAGEWSGDSPNGTRDSINPANGTVVGTSPHGSAALAGDAVAAARQAFETSPWASEPRLRAKVLLEFADRLEARQVEIANLMTSENGKVLSQAMHEIAAGYGEARYYAGIARNIFGRTFESGAGRMSMLTREPAGVVSVIVPWNAPVTLLVRSVAPALAAGCAVVIKPATQTPLTNGAVVSCFDQIADLPPGIVNSVNEYGIEVGQVFSSHREIDVVSFTGSSRTGKIVMQNASQTIKHVSLELGGKAPALVFDDADLDRVVAEIKRASLALNGQMCTSVSRVLVQRNTYRDVSQLLIGAFGQTRIGDPAIPGVELGPLIDRNSQRRVLDIVKRADAEASLLLRGEAVCGELASGNFVSPTIFEIDDVAHPLVQEEHLGPIISLEVFDDEDDALARANATRYGLASSVFTRDLNRAMRISRHLKFGTVWLNCHNRLLAEAETGGYRESGIGRLHGIEAMNDFLETKHIYFEA